jgi:flagellar hook-basal body complex protein FliE
MMIAGLQSVSAAVSGISTASNLSTGMLPAGTAKNGGSLFGDLFKDAVGKTNELEDQARMAINGLMTGTGVDVHDVMIASEKASMAFEMALAVRNKAIQSYQSVMSMQF